MVLFFVQDIVFVLKGKLHYKKWLKEVALQSGKKLGVLNIIFCSDSYLLEMNRRFLGHDYYTDVITFDSSDMFPGKGVSGDIFISIDTVRRNAGEYAAASFDEELSRVMAHGLLHLIGFKDNTDEDRIIMRLREEESLRMFEQM